MSCNSSDFPDRLRDYKNLTREGGSAYHAACPFVDPDGNRLVISPSRVVPGHYIVWCRQCGMKKFIPMSEAEAKRSRSERKREVKRIPLAYVKMMCEDLGEHRGYFRSCGISDEIIDDHWLGWNADMDRYSIPMIEDGVVFGIQYRASKPEQKPRYLSEKGGNNRKLFNSHVCKGRTLACLYILESPRDTLAMESRGLPAVSSFAGNSIGGWDIAWNEYFAGALSIVIVSDNDDNGPALALDKAKRIPRSSVFTVPPPFKDVGEAIAAGSNLEFLPMAAVARRAYDRYKDLPLLRQGV